MDGFIPYGMKKVIFIYLTIVLHPGRIASLNQFIKFALWVQ